MELGAVTISCLVETWEGHLTPTEPAHMADCAGTDTWCAPPPDRSVSGGTHSARTRSGGHCCRSAGGGDLVW